MASVYIGLDIGGTKLLAAAADAEGRLLRRMHASTPADLNEGLDVLRAMTREMAGTDDVLAIGASAGGPLDYLTGIVSPLHQPAWRDVPLKSLFEAEFGCLFSVDVDTNAAALAEYQQQASSERPESLLYLTLSTGMGGGLVVDGTLFRGANGVHPEVGHQEVPFTGSFQTPVLCECGAQGCLEALVSGNGIRRLYGRPAQELTPNEWREVAGNLGRGLRNMVCCYAPDMVAIGGGVAVGGGEAFVAEAARVMTASLRLVPAPVVRLSRLGYDTALHGAVALARAAA